VTTLRMLTVVVAQLPAHASKHIELPRLRQIDHDNVMTIQGATIFGIVPN
jgi:hypothetical protein